MNLKSCVHDSGDTQAARHHHLKNCLHLLCLLVFCSFSLSNAFAGGPYIGHGDGTITDQQTSLMWQQSVESEKRNHADAYQYCADLELGEHSDWRLPESGELMGLWIEENSTTYHCFIDPLFECYPGYYMSNTSCGVGITDVGFGTKSTYCVHISLQADYVRCVRDASCILPTIDTFSSSSQTIKPGETAILNWSISNADSATIGQEIGSVNATSGSIDVTPSKTTTYTLNAVNACGTATESVTVTIINDRTPTVKTIKTGLAYPTGIVLDNENNIFVSEFLNNRVLKIDNDTFQVSVVADISDGITKPLGLAIDPSGNLYVANNLSKIVKIAETGEKSVVTDNLPTLIGDILYTQDGELFVSEFDFDTYRNENAYRVFRIDPANGSIINTYNVGSGPYGLLHFKDNILVAHIDDHSLRAINLESSVVVDLNVNEPPVACLGDIVFTNSGCIISTEIIPMWENGSGSPDEILRTNIHANNTTTILYDFDYTFGIAINNKGDEIFITSYNDGKIHKITNFDDLSCKENKCNSLIPMLQLLLD